MEIARLKGLAAVNVCLTTFTQLRSLRWKMEDDAQFKMQ